MINDHNDYLKFNYMYLFRTDIISKVWRFHLWFFGGVRVAHLFSFLCCPIMCFYVLSFVLWCPLWFPHKKLCSVHLYLQLFVGGLMFYLHCLCVVVSNTYCVALCLSLSCVPCVASFSGLSIFDCPLGTLLHLFKQELVFLH